MNELIIVTLVSDGIRDTSFQVIFQNHHYKGTDRTTRGCNLLQSVEAVPVVLHHLANASDLTFNPVYSRK